MLIIYGIFGLRWLCGKFVKGSDFYSSLIIYLRIISAPIPSDYKSTPSHLKKPKILRRYLINLINIVPSAHIPT